MPFAHCSTCCLFMPPLCRHVNFVCGGDDQTYTNPCMADCRNVTVACQGPCPCQANPSSSVSGNSYRSFQIESMADCRNVCHYGLPGTLSLPSQSQLQFQVIVSDPRLADCRNVTMPARGPVLAKSTPAPVFRVIVTDPSI
jgi:hypothetical protein